MMPFGTKLKDPDRRITRLSILKGGLPNGVRITTHRPAQSVGLREVTDDTNLDKQTNNENERKGLSTDVDQARVPSTPLDPLVPDNIDLFIMKAEINKFGRSKIPLGQSQAITTTALRSVPSDPVNIPGRGSSEKAFAATWKIPPIPMTTQNALWTRNFSWPSRPR